VVDKVSSIIINQPRSSYFVGGAEMVSLEHAKHLANKGHDITFVTIRPGSIRQAYSRQYLNVKEAYSGTIQFIEIDQQPEAEFWYGIDPGENRDRWNVESLYLNRSLFVWLESSEQVYDVMLSYYKLDAVTIPRHKVKVSALYLCGMPHEQNTFMSSFLAMYDKIVAITDEVREYWQQYTALTVYVVPTGVDAERFKPRAKGDKRIRVLFIGRLIERKGADALIEACGLLPDEIKKITSVMIIGDGPQLCELRKLVNATGISGMVQFIGKTDEPEKYLATADICVFPSRYGEGLQGVVLESMASGAYTIVSNTEINRLLIGDGRGALIDPNSTQQIADAIVKAVTNGAHRTVVHDLSIEYVRMNYNWAQIVDRLMERVR